VPKPADSEAVDALASLLARHVTSKFWCGLTSPACLT
jgi:hypothetical protein